MSQSALRTEPSGYRQDASTQDHLPVAPTEVLRERNDLVRNARLTEWFNTWRGAMCRWLSSRSAIQPADLDDVAQEVFLRLLRYSDEAVVEYPQSYLFRIATNVVNEWHERARNKLPHDEAGLDELKIEPQHEPENNADLALLDKQVQLALSRLPQRQRAVLLLHINDDLTYKQIAVKLKLTPRVVRRDIANAYAQLRCDLHNTHLAAAPPMFAVAAGGMKRVSARRA